MKEKIYIIIVTYNGMRWLEECLSTTKPYPVVVIDNNSTDDTVHFIEQHYPELILLKQHENLGFGKSNNIGIKYALEQDCHGVFLLNQDAYLEPDTISNLYDFYVANQEYGLLSPIHLDGSGKRLDRNFSHYLEYDHNHNFYSDALLRDVEGCYDVPFVNAAAWFLPRKSLEDIGGFDPIFHHYGEDDNYCQRLIYHKRKIGVLAKTWVRHDREYKIKNNLSLTPTDYFKKSEHIFKKVWADISKETSEKEVHYPLQRQFLKTILFFLRGKFSVAKKQLKLYKFQKKWLKEVLISKSINRKNGAHYI
ncbi:MAG TPA: glycosyltransferase [Leeuwenhoekiella sp.]|nr:glycosyltransferase [Leeuwenhoekiella sp.]